MADVSRSVPFSKKLSNAADMSSNHIYHDVFSAPIATKLNSSTFPVLIDDYREIFSPSDASLGSSIPILDLPPLDRSDVIDRARSPAMDYAGVIGGLGDDDRFGIPAEEMLRELNKNAKSDVHSSRSSMQIKIPVSKKTKSQEFFCDSGNSQASKSLTKTRMAVSKSQEFCRSSRDNPSSIQASNSPTKTRKMVSKDQEFCGSWDNPTSSQTSKNPTKTSPMLSTSQTSKSPTKTSPILSTSHTSKIPTKTSPLLSTRQTSKSPTKTSPVLSTSQEFSDYSRDNPTISQASKGPSKTSPTPSLSQASKSPTKTRPTLSKSQECGSSRDNPTSSNVATDQQCDSIIPSDFSNQKTNQLAKDVPAEMTQIAPVHAVPGDSRIFEEVSPARKTSLSNPRRMSMDGADFSMDVSKEKTQGKHTRAVSDLGTDKQTVDHEARLNKEFGEDGCYTFHATRCTREINLRSQTFSVSPLSSSPQLFSSNDYFRRSKSSNNQQRDAAAAGSSSPLLELDVNSAAALSAAALKSAIEDAEAKIRWAKEFLEGQEGDGSTKLTFRDCLRVKTTSRANHSNSYEAHGLKWDDTLEVEAGTTEKSNFNKAGGLKSKDDLNFRTPTESQLADEAGMLNEKLHAFSVQEDTGTRDCVGFQSTCAAETFEETENSLEQKEYANGAELKEKTNSHVVANSTEKSHKHEGGGEWEAAKHFSQLISGVKNKLVSFISKQADTEKIAVQEDAPSASSFVEHTSGGTFQVHDADVHQIKRETDQDGFEKEVTMNRQASSGVGDFAQDSNRRGMEIDKPGESETKRTVALEEGVLDKTTSLDAEMLISQQYDSSEPDQQFDQIEVQESIDAKGELMQEDGRENEVKRTAVLEQGKFDDITASTDVEMLINQQRDPSEPDQELDQIDVQEVVGFERELIQEDVKEREVKRTAVLEQGDIEDTTVYPDVEMLINQQCDPSEPAQEFDQIDVQEAVDVKQELIQEDVKEREMKSTVVLEQGETEVTTASADVEILNQQCDPSEPEQELDQIDVQETVDVKRELIQEDVQENEVKSTVVLEQGEIEDTTASADVEMPISQQYDLSKPEQELDQIDVQVSDVKGELMHDGAQENEVITVSPDVEMLISQQCDLSKDEQDLIQIEVEELADVKGELIEEDVQDNLVHSPEILDDHAGCEHEKGQMDTNEREEENDIEQEATYQSRGYDLKEETNYKDNNEIGKEVQDHKPVVEEVEESYDAKDGTEQQEETYRWSDLTEMPKDSNKKPEVFERVEETCTDELQERVQAEDLFKWEDSKTTEHLGAKSNLTGLMEVADDRSEHDKHAAFAHDVSENEESLVYCKDKEACLHDERIQYAHAQHVESSSVSEERIAEPQLVREDTCEQKPTEELSSLRGEDEACGFDDIDQYLKDVNFTTVDEERMTESNDTTFETKRNIEQPGSLHTINELIGKEMHEQTGCSTEVADETLDHDECSPSVDVCNEEAHSCLNESSVGYRRNAGNEHVQGVKFSFEDERMTESTAVTSKPEWIAEQPRSVQTVAKLIEEEMNETSISASDLEEFYIIEEETACDVLSPANNQKSECETDVDFEREHANEETFTTDIGSEIQGDETDIGADVGDVDMATDQDTGIHVDVETSYKRKRWFENRDEVVNDECGIGIHVRQDDACSSLEENCHSVEATHRRRRWFENRGHEVLHKPSVLDGIAMDTQRDDQVAQESELKSASDQVEARTKAEAAHRRRRWFDDGEKLAAAQRLSILGVEANQEEESEMGEDNANYDEHGETFMENKHQNQLKSREKEKERERKAVERAIREARQRAFVEVQERASVEARQKAAATSQDNREGKDSSEAKIGPDKATVDSKLRAERAAVERATAEARDRALQRALFDKDAYKSKEKNPKNQTSGPSCSSKYSSAPFATDKSSGVLTESPQRRKAISERNRRTVERAAKALEEKNMRDLVAQKEQNERNRFADSLDADVKRWLTGIEGNLRAMLSTLQYILGPESGWQPVPLTELMTSTAVRKAYKRAALCVHPDKLQQRGATIQQKYICEKVFYLLKDAWQKFNPDDR